VRTKTQPYPALTRYALLVGIILAAFALRLHDIGRSSLRGDEAFTIRYWAQSPAVVLDSLAWVEPHPFGAFFSFWAWKSTIGDSEFAMRLLPALLNLLGIPALYSLTHDLLRRRGSALMAALAWAVSASLIWHSQDARNYAMWAGMSAVSLAALLRASRYGGRWRWGWYVLFSTLALYLFFLEAFFVLVHGLWIAWFRHRKLRAWVSSAAVIGLLLIPSVGQIIALSGSGYRGTATRAEPAALISVFLPALFIGEGLTSAALSPFVPLLLLAALALWLWMAARRPPAGALVMLLLVVPALLLVLVSTRMDVFRPRYLLAITPALALLVGGAWAALWSTDKGWRKWTAIAAGAALLLTYGVLTADSLSTLYAPTYTKAPAWRDLQTALRREQQAGDTLILVSSDPASGILDPASGYYFPENERTLALPHPNFDTTRTLQTALDESDSVWVVMTGDGANAVTTALDTLAQRLWQFSAGDFRVSQYRSPEIHPNEITSPLAVHLGGGTISGYRLEGAAHNGDTLRLLVYWQEAPAAEWKTFIHLTGAAQPDGSNLWAQDDHPPQTTGRDVYRLHLDGLPTGEYTLQMGLYRPDTGERATVTRADGQAAGDILPLQTVIVNAD
jgi:mannosyltransferase